LDQLTSKQLSEWEAYDRLDPTGDWRFDFGIGRLQALIINISNLIYNDPKKGKPTVVSPLDCMPDWAGDRKGTKQSVEDMKQVLLGLMHTQTVQKKRKEALKITATRAPVKIPVKQIKRKS